MHQPQNHARQVPRFHRQTRNQVPNSLEKTNKQMSTYIIFLFFFAMFTLCGYKIGRVVGHARGYAEGERIGFYTGVKRGRQE